MPNAGRDAIKLMEWMFQWNVKKRPTCDQILQHPYFTNYISEIELNKASDILNGRGAPTDPSNQEIESLKVGPNGI